MQRLTFKCFNCERTYQLNREIQGQPKLEVACPYCDTKAVADLRPFWRQNNKIEVHKDLQGQSLSLDMFDLPDVLPTVGF
ncbi:hypothetical protein QUF63_09485 [Anaerolineales bacterium HSG25]|nr:hypothetical protein [Anaerolineales bacterium HSG25]